MIVGLLLYVVASVGCVLAPGFAALLVFRGLQGAAPAIILDHWHMTETGFAALTLPIIGGYAIGAQA